MKRQAGKLIRDWAVGLSHRMWRVVCVVLSGVEGILQVFFFAVIWTCVSSMSLEKWSSGCFG